MARSVISAQSASPTFTHVYAALVAIINTKFPQIGELIGKRLIITFQRAFKRNDKKICLSSVRFIAHLVNQQVIILIIILTIIDFDHPKFLLHFLIHIDVHVLMLCRKFKVIPTSIFQVTAILRKHQKSDKYLRL